MDPTEADEALAVDTVDLTITIIIAATDTEDHHKEEGIDSKKPNNNKKKTQNVCILTKALDFNMSYHCLCVSHPLRLYNTPSLHVIYPNRGMITFIKAGKKVRRRVYAKWRCGAQLLLSSSYATVNIHINQPISWIMHFIISFSFLYVLSALHTRQCIHSECHCWEFIVQQQQQRLYRTYTSQI